MPVLVPAWPLPPGVRAAFTTRAGGVSRGAFASLNLGSHVGDAPEAVAENRRRVRTALELPREPAWLRQVHGTRVVELDPAGPTDAPEADASFSRHPGVVCCVQVADCLPVLFASSSGPGATHGVVAAAHAGWRGLAAGVLEATVRALPVPAAQLSAWLGPAIGPQAFEVGEEVRAAFLAQDPAAQEAFAANACGRWQCDLDALARQRLLRAGVREVHGGGLCTARDAERFFSYRREARLQGNCGRMAALIWIEP